MAWNAKTHIGVLAFRGTASMANVLADLQVSFSPALLAADQAEHQSIASYDSAVSMLSSGLLVLFCQRYMTLEIGGGSRM